MIVQNINKQKQINEIIQRFTNRHLFKRFYFIPVFICAFLCSLKVRWRSKKRKGRVAAVFISKCPSITEGSSSLSLQDQRLQCGTTHCNEYLKQSKHILHNNELNNVIIAIARSASHISAFFSLQQVLPYDRNTVVLPTALRKC